MGIREGAAEQLRRIGRGLTSYKEVSFMKPSVDEIDESVVAKAIDEHIFRHLDVRNVTKTFSNYDVVSIMGFIPREGENSEFEEAYKNSRKALDALCAANILERLDLEEPDGFDERFYYRLNQDKQKDAELNLKQVVRSKLKLAQQPL